MEQNYLHGADAPKINAMLAATGWNLKKLMKKLKEELLWLYDFITIKAQRFNLIILEPNMNY
jgi:IS5 family transposase